jgi:hypothetical protein
MTSKEYAEYKRKEACDCDEKKKIKCNICHFTGRKTNV